MTSPAYNEDLMREVEHTIREAYKRGDLTVEQISQLENAGFKFPKTFSDHTGQIFFSQRAMCEAWGVDLDTYTARLKRGWTVEQALTGIRYHDHEGNGYKTKMDMCRAWGVSAYDYDRYLKNGCTLEEALTGKEQQEKPKETQAEPVHNRDEFIAPESFSAKSAIAFECKVVSSHCLIDHYDHVFKSIEDLCKYWKISARLFRIRLSSGDSPHEVFSYLMEKRYRPKTKRRYEDHLGFKFESIEELCAFWNISSLAFHKRQREGMDIETIIKSLSDISHK